MLAATVVVVTILFILSYVIFDRDLLAPPTAVALVFIFGTLCALYNEKRWGLEFPIKSMGLIAAGIIATIVGGIIGVFLLSLFRNRTLSFSFSHKETKAEDIIVSPLKTFIIISFQAVALAMVILHIRNMTGISNPFLAAGAYRRISTSEEAVQNLSLRMPMLTRNLMQASNMTAIIYAYIVGNNLIASTKKITLNWIPLILFSITTFIQGDRSNMIRLWVIALVVAYTIHRRSVGWRSRRETKKIIRRIAFSVVLMGVFFVAVREMTGNSTTMDPLQYVTFYAGSPIAVLDHLWSENIVKPEIFGQKTFYYLNHSLTALIGWPGRYFYYAEFLRSSNGAWIGNAPTAFKPAFREFGPFGFFLFFAFMGAFFTIIYCKCRDKKGNNHIDFRLLMYAYIAYTFMMYFYASFFDFLSHTMIKYMVELLIIRWFLVGWNIKKSITFTFGKSNKELTQGSDNLLS